MRLEGKAAIVTGGTSGIGKAIAERFLAEGAEVVVFGLKNPHGVPGFVRVDVSDEKQVRAALASIKRLDILVNNAGIYAQASVEETTEEQLDRIIGVNFKGTYWMCKHALPLLKRGKGSIVNVASALGVVAEPESPAYCSTKAAIIMLTKCMAQEYARQGVRVNAILPGPIDTPLLRASLPTEKDMAESAAKNPMRRIGRPEDVANVALFLASDEAGYVTGSAYPVDGGESSSSVYSK